MSSTEITLDHQPGAAPQNPVGNGRRVPRVPRTGRWGAGPTRFTALLVAAALALVACGGSSGDLGAAGSDDRGDDRRHDDDHDHGRDGDGSEIAAHGTDQDGVDQDSDVSGAEPGRRDLAADAGVDLAYGAAGASDSWDIHDISFGLAVPGSDPAAVTSLEAEAGAKVGVVRIFARWDTTFPGPHHRELLDEGRLVHLSVRPRTDAGRTIAWSEIAAAQPGSAIYDQLELWVTTVAAYGDQVYFTLNHEPETADSAANGSAEDYIAAWRKMASLLRAAGGDEVQTVLVLGRGAYADGSIDDWYPGDDVVDIIGVDAYNWYDCQGTNREWTKARHLLLPAFDFASDHDKRLAIPEIASTEDPEDPARKAEWIRQLGDVAADAELGSQIEFVAWFSVHDRSWPDCEWEYDSSSVSATAFTDLVARFAR